MAELSETPLGNRIRISFFGLRNAGKSTLVNALANQNVSIVNAKPGTTTDPVSKAMEILPLGPCLLTDTAGLDDTEGELGAQRVQKTLGILHQTDIAVWVRETEKEDEASPFYASFKTACLTRNIPILHYTRGDNVVAFKLKIADLQVLEKPLPLVADLVEKGDLVICVCPIDSAAPKGRLILPQQQVVRELLDAGACALVCRETELAQTLHRLKDTPVRFVITDSQAFGVVSKIVPPHIPLTSFSLVFARQKGDLNVFAKGIEALQNLQDGDAVLISEACSHHRQCDSDIGTVKLPKWIETFTDKKLQFAWSSGATFPEDLARYKLVVHCGGCMLSRRGMMERLAECTCAHVPILNYGLAIATCHHIKLQSTTEGLSVFTKR